MPAFRSPLVAQFADHWRSLCRDGRIPTSEDYLDRLEPRVAPYLMMFDCLDDDIRVRFQGTSIVQRRGLEQTGRSWFEFNKELNARRVVEDVRLAVRQPCGIWTWASFVTDANRGLDVEALSLPVRTKPGRPARMINISADLNPLQFDDRAKGWQGPVRIDWLDLGFGVPHSPPQPPIG